MGRRQKTRHHDGMPSRWRVFIECPDPDLAVIAAKGLGIVPVPLVLPTVMAPLGNEADHPERRPGPQAGPPSVPHLPSPPITQPCGETTRSWSMAAKRASE